MTGLRTSIITLWIIGLGAFFLLARPAAARAVLYSADPIVAPWVSAAAALESERSGRSIQAVGPRQQPDLEIGRLDSGAEVAKTRLVVAAWEGSPAGNVSNPVQLAAWLDAVRAGTVRFAVPGQNSPLGRDFQTLLGDLDPQAETDFYRGAERLRDRDDLYLEDFRKFGPAGWDAGILYEDAALQITRLRAEEGIEPLLRIHYLENAPEIVYRAEGTDAGVRFIFNLLSPDGRSLALEYGIRPLDPDAQSPNSLFQRFANLGAQPPS